MNVEPQHGHGRKHPVIDFDRHSPEYRTEFEHLATEMPTRCPVAWTDRHDGYWVASSHEAVFTIARRPDVVSNDHDVTGANPDAKGITIPYRGGGRGGFLEMDPPEQRFWRDVLNPYLSPKAVERWRPMAQDLIRAALNERIGTGSIDFVDDLANVVPAVMTMAMLGLPLEDWTVHCEPAHAAVYTVPDSLEWQAMIDMLIMARVHLQERLVDIRDHPRPGMIDALFRAEFDGRPPTLEEVDAHCALLIGGGLDTTTSLTANTLHWLSDHPQERERLSAERDTLLRSATEEFLRYFTPAVGDGRNITGRCEMADTRFEQGDRVWLSWALANRDPEVFPDPHRLDLARKANRHASFGLGIHRCIGSNLARVLFQSMLTAVLDRMPDFACEPSGAVHYDTTGIINGMKHLPATFTPGPRIGGDLAEAVAHWQRQCDEQRLAEPVTVSARTGT